MSRKSYQQVKNGGDSVGTIIEHKVVSSIEKYDELLLKQQKKIDILKRELKISNWKRRAISNYSAG